MLAYAEGREVCHWSIPAINEIEIVVKGKILPWVTSVPVTNEANGSVAILSGNAGAVQIVLFIDHWHDTTSSISEAVDKRWMSILVWHMEQSISSDFSPVSDKSICTIRSPKNDVCVRLNKRREQSVTKRQERWRDEWMVYQRQSGKLAHNKVWLKTVTWSWPICTQIMENWPFSLQIRQAGQLMSHKLRMYCHNS